MRLGSAALALLLCGPLLPAETASSLLTPTVSVPSNSVSAMFSTYIQVKSPKCQDDNLKVVPLWDSQNLPNLTPSVPKKKHRTGSEQFWLVTWVVSGVVPTPPTSYPMLLISGQTASFAQLTLQARPAADFTVTVRPPIALWAVDKNPYSSVTIDTALGELHRVRVSASTLINPDTNQQMGPESFALSPDAGCAVDWENPRPIPIKGAPATVYLCFNPKLELAGKYLGQLWLTSDEKHDFTSVQLTVFATSFSRQLIGVGLILLGIVLFFVVTVLIRRRSNRLAAILPAARLLDACGLLQTRLAKIVSDTGVDWPVQRNATISGTLAYLSSQLQTSNLDKQGYLPTTIGNPASVQTLDTQYQLLLQRSGAQVDALTLFINEGLGLCADRWPAVTAAHVETAGQGAMRAIQTLFPFSGPSDGLRRQLASVVAGLDNAIAVAAGSTSRSGGAAVPPPLTVDQINVQLNHASWLLFSVWGALTLLVGVAALILGHDGFGTGPDLLRCFLWGLGLQAAGSSLQQLGPTAITSAFSLQISR